LQRHLLSGARAELRGHCAAGARTRGVRCQLRIFGPRLHDEIRLERFDDVACSFASFLRGKSRNVVAVPMRGHDGVELAPGPLFDVFGYIHHARFWYPCGKTSRSEIDQHVSFRFSAVRKADEKAITESDVVSADCRTGGRLRHFSVLSDQAATVELGEVRLRTRWWSELRLRTWGRAWRKRLVEEALFPQVIEPGLLPFGILKSVRDLIFELPVLVEDESSSAKDPDAASRIDSLRRNEAELLLQLVGLKRQDLNVFSHGFMQHKTVGTDPDRRTNRLDLDVAVGVDFKHFAIFPYQSEHLLRLVQHRIVVAPAIDQLLVAPLPGAVDIGFARLLNAIIVEIFEQRLAIAVLLIVRNNFAVDGEKGG